MTLVDRSGSAVDTTPAALEHYERGLDAMLRFAEDPDDQLGTAAAEDPAFVLPTVARAYGLLLATERPLARDAEALLDALPAEGAPTPREQAHLAAARALAAGDFTAASRALDVLLVDHPRDALALFAGHQVDFFTGNSANLRDRVARVRTAWPDDDPRTGYVLGMLAFGLEETGLYPQAEEAGRDAVARNPDDVWAIHAVTHTFEMRARVADGLAFLAEHAPAWTAPNYLSVHNHWHRALFLLDRGDVAGVLAHYDDDVFRRGEAELALELLDATALLWRLHLDGVDVGDRWNTLADRWAAKPDVGHYAFNDVHAVMAFVAAGRPGDAARVVTQLRALAVSDESATNRWMTERVGLPVAEAVVAVGEERYDDVVEHLLPVRTRLHEFGGSHAQRDVWQRTLLEAAVRGGQHHLAERLASERVTVAPGSTYNRRALERARAA